MDLEELKKLAEAAEKEGMLKAASMSLFREAANPQTILALIAEVDRLRTRLEIDPRHNYDGIDCRDTTIRELERDLEEARRDAERYRWLRQQNWNDAALCVVARPKDAVKLGHDCPSMERLDAAIDAAREQKG